jgi:hypothetical protein
MPAKVKIFIDSHRYNSPDPTTGEALYALADIGPRKDLFREVDGEEAEQPIPRDGTAIDLVEDEHFYSDRVFTVIVNTEDKQVTERRQSFNDVVLLAFNPPPTGPNVGFTITYRKGPPANRKGSLLEGGFVRIKEGMIFDVTPTDRS